MNAIRHGTIAPKICVIIPAFKVRAHILAVIAQIGTEVDKIYVVDDRCPEASGLLVETECKDARVRVLYNDINLGVGGAVKTGYQAGTQDQMDIFVKIDGDGQMPPALLPRFIAPIISAEADYTKGNRFYFLESLQNMPPVRKAGNAVLSFINKFTSGYWDIFDPTNGYTAIHRKALSLLPLEKIDDRYFFESDMLFRLGTLRAVVRDIPMDAVYADERSNLRPSDAIIRFIPLYTKAFAKRIFYNYFLRDFNVASLEFIVGMLFFSFGVGFGVFGWLSAASAGQLASTGTVMLAVVPLILGFQLLLSALHYDISLNCVPD
jgi:dolichol-phosphate mannosyltransferase